MNLFIAFEPSVKLHPWTTSPYDKLARTNVCWPRSLDLWTLDLKIAQMLHLQPNWDFFRLPFMCYKHRHGSRIDCTVQHGCTVRTECR